MLFNSKYRTPSSSGLLAIATGALALVAVTGTSQAGILTGSSAPGIYVDGSNATDTISLTGGTTVSNVTLTVDFTKCDDPFASGPLCTTPGRAFHNEIVFKLTHLGVTIDLTEKYTYSVKAHPTGYGQHAIVTFDDAASDLVGSTNPYPGTDTGYPEDGAFQPIGELSDFLGLTAAGDWTLYVEDTNSSDPLYLHEWSIDVTSDDPIVTPPPPPPPPPCCEPPPPPPPPAAVSEPGTLAILGLGIIGLGVARRRRIAK
jgi:hypothetical protein